MSHAYSILILQQAREAALKTGKVSYAFIPVSRDEHDNIARATQRLAELVTGVRMQAIGEPVITQDGDLLVATQAVQP